jgi:diphthamide biosynthesis methyltransferase
MERQFGEGVIPPYQKIVILCKAGSDSRLYYNEIEQLQPGLIDSTPAVLIVPGKMHFTEEDFLQKFRSV